MLATRRKPAGGGDSSRAVPSGARAVSLESSRLAATARDGLGPLRHRHAAHLLRVPRTRLPARRGTESRLWFGCRALSQRSAYEFTRAAQLNHPSYTTLLYSTLLYCRRDQLDRRPKAAKGRLRSHDAIRYRKRSRGLYSGVRRTRGRCQAVADNRRAQVALSKGTNNVLFRSIYSVNIFYSTRTVDVSTVVYWICNSGSEEFTVRCYVEEAPLPQLAQLQTQIVDGAREVVFVGRCARDRLRRHAHTRKRDSAAVPKALLQRRLEFAAANWCEHRSPRGGREIRQA